MISTCFLLELVYFPYYHHPKNKVPKHIFNFYSASLNLDTARQLASLITLYYMDISTRDLEYFDLSIILDRAMIFPHRLKEI